MRPKPRTPQNAASRRHLPPSGPPLRTPNANLTPPITRPLQEKKAPVVKMSQDDMDADLDSYIKGRAGDAAEAPADAAVPATE